MSNKTILITGATSGIGKATALKYASENNNIIITGRRKKKLDELAKELTQKYSVNVFSLCFDVSIKKEVVQAINSLPKEFQKIDILVNNAGLAAGLDFFDEANDDDWEEMINTNIKGLLYVSREVISLIKKNKKGHIINIGSIAGKNVYEKGNVYCATKFAVDALSQSMRVDLLKYGIKVTAIHPGAVETEFSLVRFKGDAEKAKNVYKGYQPLSAKDIADTIYYCTSLPEHVCINDLVITPTAQANPFYIHKKL
jgi:3-hydroxy acid dehydrogenase/malonic semialdehyde reductase